MRRPPQFLGVLRVQKNAVEPKSQVRQANASVLQDASA